MLKWPLPLGDSTNVPHRLVGEYAQRIFFLLNFYRNRGGIEGKFYTPQKQAVPRNIPIYIIIGQCFIPKVVFTRETENA